MGCWGMSGNALLAATPFKWVAKMDNDNGKWVARMDNSGHTVMVATKNEAL